MKRRVLITAGDFHQRYEGDIELELDTATQTDAMVAVSRWSTSAEGLDELNKFAPDRKYYAIHME